MSPTERPRKIGLQWIMFSQTHYRDVRGAEEKSHSINCRSLFETAKLVNFELSLNDIL